MEIKNQIREICKLFPEELAKLILGFDSSVFYELEEIRLRRERAVSICCKGKNLFLSVNGDLSIFSNDALVLSGIELEEVYLKLCRNSVYSYQKDLASGFITLEGGHRAGICGSIVTNENNEITGITNISTINIRVAREVKDCGEEAFRSICDNEKIHGTLIISPPKYGKTTMLRDIARLISSKGKRVCVIDERSEIASVKDGVPTLDVGPLTDVYDCVSKPEGIMRALRTMAPEVIICDEIGGDKEAEGILGAVNCGVPVIATAHAANISELRKRSGMKKLLDSGAFSKIIVLDSRYKIKNFIDTETVKNYELKKSSDAAGISLRDSDRRVFLCENIAAN